MNFFMITNVINVNGYLDPDPDPLFPNVDPDPLLRKVGSGSTIPKFGSQDPSKIDRSATLLTDYFLSTHTAVTQVKGLSLIFLLPIIYKSLINNKKKALDSFAEE